LAVLRAVGLELDELGELGDAVRGVRLLGVPVPQRTLGEGHRRELGVRADGAEHPRLVRLAGPGLDEQTAALVAFGCASSPATLDRSGMREHASRALESRENL